MPCSPRSPRVGRTYLSAGAGFIAERAGLAVVLHHQRADRLAEPGPARLAAAARPFTGLAKPTRIVMDD